jgi:hypothetical protein
MKPLSSFVHRCSTKILSATVVASLFSVPITATAQTKEPSPAAETKQPTAAEREEWRKALMATPRPTNGCYTATYPERQWREIPCKTPPSKPYFPRAGGMTQPEMVGGSGPDFTAVVTGHITQAEGSFDSVTGVTATPAYSLQLNTDFFPTSTCSGSPNISPNIGGCRGWEQFVYESAGTGFIQYWLINYGPAGTMCPMPRGAHCVAGQVSTDGWCPFTIGMSPNPLYCAVNAAAGAPAPAEPATSLGQMRVNGAAAGVNGAANDAMTVTVGGTPFSAGGNNYFPDLGTKWQEAEFNVFGNCCNNQAVFNSGSSAIVRIEVVSGTNLGPGCTLRSFTGESNNLTLVNSPPASPAPLPAPALVFSESNPAPGGSAATCADAVSLGDTHLTTFGGLLYDFQATGDFLLAETGPDFLVQTRQASGAPTWPNAAVNKAVAVQTGKNRVAICLPERVVVDGRSARIRDGGRLGLSGGGNVIRTGNVYFVLGASGDRIRAAVNGSYIDVSVGLGRWPNDKVRGLLANANDRVTEIAARDGAVLTSPFDFEKLYGHYTTSWRVASNESILSSCGKGVKSGIPRKPFFATDLAPQLARRNQAICKEAGVKEGPLLDACMIDVAMIGPRAAKVFVGRPMPIAVGDARRY